MFSTFESIIITCCTYNKFWCCTKYMNKKWNHFCILLSKCKALTDASYKGYNNTLIWNLTIKIIKQSEIANMFVEMVNQALSKVVWPRSLNIFSLFAYHLSTCRTLFGDEKLDFARSTGLKITTSAALHRERRCCAWASKRDKCKCIGISNFDLRSSTTDPWRIVDSSSTC